MTGSPSGMRDFLLPQSMHVSHQRMSLCMLMQEENQTGERLQIFQVMKAPNKLWRYAHPERIQVAMHRDSFLAKYSI